MALNDCREVYFKEAIFGVRVETYIIMVHIMANRTFVFITVLCLAVALITLNCCQSSGIQPDFNERALSFSFTDTASYRIVQLETPEGLQTGTINELLFDGDLIFTIDYSESFAVSVFNSEGKYLSGIYQSSSEPVNSGEYHRSKLSFDLDRKRKEIILYDVLAASLLRFTYNGQFLNETKLVEYRGSEFAYLGDDRYAFWMNNDSEYQVLITDSTGVQISGYHYIDPKYSGVISALPGFFSKGEEEGVYYIPIWEDAVYSITTSGIRKVFDLGFKHKIVGTSEEISLLESGQLQDKYSCFYSLFVTRNNHFYAGIRYLGDMMDETIGIPLHVFGSITDGKTEAGIIRTSTTEFRKYGFGIGYPNGVKGDYFVRVLPGTIVRDALPDYVTGEVNGSSRFLFFYRISL